MENSDEIKKDSEDGEGMNISLRRNTRSGDRGEFSIQTPGFSKRSRQKTLDSNKIYFVNEEEKIESFKYQALNDISKGDLERTYQPHQELDNLLLEDTPSNEKIKKKVYLNF